MQSTDHLIKHRASKAHPSLPGQHPVGLLAFGNKQKANMKMTCDKEYAALRSFGPLELNLEKL
jgi:hypothetical protein